MQCPTWGLQCFPLVQPIVKPDRHALWVAQAGSYPMGSLPDVLVPKSLEEPFLVRSLELTLCICSELSFEVCFVTGTCTDRTCLIPSSNSTHSVNIPLFLDQLPEVQSFTKYILLMIMVSPERMLVLQREVLLVIVTVMPISGSGKCSSQMRTDN